MKKVYLVNESLNEFAKRGRPRKARANRVIANDPDQEDTWYTADDEFDSEDPVPGQIEDVELEDDEDVVDTRLTTQLYKMLDRELARAEFSRGSLKFKVKSTGEKVSGVPLAKLSGGEAFLFKTASGMKKVRVDDMIVESYVGEQIFVSETFRDYE